MIWRWLMNREQYELALANGPARLPFESGKHSALTINFDTLSRGQQVEIDRSDADCAADLSHGFTHGMEKCVASVFH